MDAFKFACEHVIAAVVIIWLICGTIFRIFNRLMRHLNIRAHGWPPAHLDADGDCISREKDVDES